MKESVNNLNSNFGLERYRKLFLLFIILIFSLVSINSISAWADNGSAIQSVNGCNSLNTTGAYYTLTDNVSATGICFTIYNQNTTLDCNNFWINYSIGGTTATYAVYTAQFNTTIKNCNIVDGNLTSTINTRYGIYFIGASNSTIYNNTITTNSSNAIFLLNSANFNNLTRNNATSNSNTGILISLSLRNLLVGNRGYSSLAQGISIVSSSYNNLINNTGITNGISSGIYLSASPNNNLTGNNGTSTSSVLAGAGIYLNGANYSNLNLNTGLSNMGLGLYILYSNGSIINNTNGTSIFNYGIKVQSSLNNIFIDSLGISINNWSIYNSPYLYSNKFLNVSLDSTSSSSNLTSFCYPNIGVDIINSSYKRSYESIWQTVKINRMNDIYTLGDSISSVNSWQSHFDSYIAVGNSQTKNYAVSGSKCYYSYERYVQNVTTNSNATVIVFCGVNDVNGGLSLENTTYYYEAMYNLSVERGQNIVFVNIGTTNSTNHTCPTVMAINEWLLNFTQFYNVPLVDFHSLMSTNAAACYPNTTITTDGLHPNTNGYIRLGKLIWQQGFNSSTLFNLSIPLIHYDQGKTYDIKCISDYDNNTYQETYTLPDILISGGGVFGNESNISTTLAGALSSSINSIGFNSSNVYYNSNLVNITANSRPVLEFNFNFSAEDFNFSTVNITNLTVDGKEFISIIGINSSAVLGGKNITIYNANSAYNSVCVKDEENVTSISSACNETNEFKVMCNSTLQSGYNCTLSGTTLLITGLNHSGAMQFNQTIAVAAAEEDSTTTDTTYSSGLLYFRPTQAQLEKGYNASVSKSNKVIFSFDDSNWTIDIKQVLKNSVDISINGKGYSAEKGEITKIDLNSDGYYDLQILINSIYSIRYASLNFKLISEEIPQEIQESAEENVTINGANEDVKWYKNNNLVYIALGIAGLLFVGFVIFKIIKKHMKKKRGY